MKYLRFLEVVILLVTSLQAFSQAVTFTSWEMTAASLSFTANQTKTVTFTVTAGKGQPNDLILQLYRLPAGQIDGNAIGNQQKITQFDFTGTATSVTKTFSVTLTSKTSDGTATHIAHNDEIILIVNGSFVPNNTYFVSISPSTPPPPPPVGVPAAPSNVTLTAIGPNEMLVGWQDNSSNETGFAIKVYWQGQHVHVNAPANSNSLIVNVPVANMYYMAWVYSFNANGNSYTNHSQSVRSPICFTSVSYTSANTNVESVTAAESITTSGGFILNTTAPVYFRSNVITLKAPTSIPHGANLYIGYGTCSVGGGGGAPPMDVDTLTQHSTYFEPTILNDLAVGLHIYPNPSSEIVTIRSVPDFQPGTDVILMDMKSHVVMTQKTNLNQAAVLLTVKDLPSGLYVVLISDGKKRTTRKLVIR
jgi:hypothetical protein